MGQIFIGRSKRDMSERSGEISRMIEILTDDKDMRTLTFYQYKGTNYQKLRPLTKIRVTKQRKGANNPTFLITLGRLNYAERQYALKFRKEYDCWPDDTHSNFPRKRA
jgi:hypothetical protein